MRRKSDLINETIAAIVIIIGLTVLFIFVHSSFIIWLPCTILLGRNVILNLGDIRSKNYIYQSHDKTKFKVADGKIIVSGLSAEEEIPCEDVTEIRIWGRHETVINKGNESPETMIRKDVIERINIETDHAIYSFDIPDTGSVRFSLLELEKYCTNATIETDYTWSEP